MKSIAFTKHFAGVLSLIFLCAYSIVAHGQDEQYPIVNGVITVGAADLDPQQITQLGSSNKVLFSGTSAAHGRELWISDGTEAGTAELYDIHGGAESANPQFLTAFKDTVYFAVGNAIWQSQGSKADTRKIFDAKDAEGKSDPITSIVTSGKFIYFSTANGIIISDGTVGTMAKFVARQIFSMQPNGNAYMIPDGIDGVYFVSKTYNPTFQFYSYGPWHLHPGNWPDLTNTYENRLETSDGSPVDCTPTGIGVFGAIDRTLFFACSSGGSTKILMASSDDITRVLDANISSKWPSIEQVGNGTRLIPDDGELHAFIANQHYVVDTSLGNLVSRGQIADDGCGPMYFVSHRLIGSHRFYLSRSQNCRVSSSAGGVYRWSYFQNFALQTDLTNGEGPLAKYKEYFKALLSYNRLSAVQAGNSIFINSQGRLEVTQLRDDQCPLSDTKSLPGACGCAVADTDSDRDGTPDCIDPCRFDPNKASPGVCGCGQSDQDSDNDSVPDCQDTCSLDPHKKVPGTCGCGVADDDTDKDGVPNCRDECSTDPNKIAAGKCGCGISETDTDRDGVPDCLDQCPLDDQKSTDAGKCGCGFDEQDTDGDRTPDCADQCPNDATKVVEGACGCNISEIDSDRDGVANCNDLCPRDGTKTAPGACGCGVADTDTDHDGTPDCEDRCPIDPSKTLPGICGCSQSDVDTDHDGISDCEDRCPADPQKSLPGSCGCGNTDLDRDSDGTADCLDLCVDDPSKSAPGVCGCGLLDEDNDDDKTLDCKDLCPADSGKTGPGVCGCGIADTDRDGDFIPDCKDLCPSDKAKAAPGICGCGVSDRDSDSNGTPDCREVTVTTVANPTIVRSGTRMIVTLQKKSGNASYTVWYHYQTKGKSGIVRWQAWKSIESSTPRVSLAIPRNPVRLEVYYQMHGTIGATSWKSNLSKRVRASTK